VAADTRTHLTAAAQRRARDTLERAHAALRRLDRVGTPITFAAVAHAANVSRSWLYRQPDLRAEITRLRATRLRPDHSTLPASQRASHASLQRRLETLLDANRTLREENARLRAQIAVLLGEQRAAATVDRPPTGVIGPCS
jgi:hypothetical protein